MYEKTVKNTRLALTLGDITKIQADAIVNAANPSLQGGSGVDGAIHKVGGPSILRECRRIIAEIGRLAPGKAVITEAGNLPASYVIHTVGPIWRGGKGNEEAVLRSAYRSSLLLADKMALRTLAFPSLSTGAYGFPLDQAAMIALQEISDYLQQSDTHLMLVEMILFCRSDLETYHLALERL